MGPPVYDSVLGIPKTLQTIANAGYVCRHVACGSGFSAICEFSWLGRIHQRKCTCDRNNAPSDFCGFRTCKAYAMRKTWFKLGTFLMLASYMLSTFGAAFLHDHSHLHGLETTVCCEVPANSSTESVPGKCKHSHTGCRHSHKSLTEANLQRSSSHDDHSQHKHPHRHLPWHDDDCLACQYSSLAQCFAPTV